MLVGEEPASTNDTNSRKGDKEERVKIQLILMHMGTPIAEKRDSLKSRRKSNVLKVHKENVFEDDSTLSDVVSWNYISL